MRKFLNPRNIDNSLLLDGSTDSSDYHVADGGSPVSPA